MKSALRDEHFFATNSRDNIYLGGVSLRQLEEDFKVDPADLAIYLPSDTSDIEKNHIQVHYLGYYLKWHPQAPIITVWSTAALNPARSARRYLFQIQFHRR